jgi:MFS family permease
MTRDPITLRSLAIRVYLPTLLFFLGDGAILPIIALAARGLGASVALAGLIVALRSVGTLFFDLPAGWIIARYGERVAIVVASCCYIGTLVGWIFTDSIAVFAVLTFIQGSGWSVWMLARLAYVSGAVGPDQRGRALSILGGVSRAGWFIGPFIGAGVITLDGRRGAYILALTFALIAAILLFRFATEDDRPRYDGRAGPKIRTIVRAHRRSLLTFGGVALAIQGLRQIRIVIVPLWANHIGLSASTTSLIFGMSAGVELLCVYVGGSIMDRRGRKAVAVPAIMVISVGISLLPLADAVWSLVLVTILLGLGNGISSGVNMTIGADLAPAAEGRAQFLGAWRVLGDSGTAGGPLLVALVTGLATLGAAAIFCGAVGIVAGVLILRFVPEPRRDEDAAPAGVSHEADTVRA